MKLLFVCSGNICRSPMAERMAVAIGRELGVRVDARSCGTLGIEDAQADAKAIKVCRELGLDLRDHRSQGVTRDLIDWADRILVMELAHAAHLREFYPEVGDKVLQLAPFVGKAEIEDPVGRWIWTFRSVRKDLDRALRAFLTRMRPHEGPEGPL